MNRRYHSYSSYDQSNEGLKIVGKCGLLYLILRELPLRHFYARSMIISVVVYYLVIHNWKIHDEFINPGETKATYYISKWDEQYFANYPMVKQLIFSRKTNKNDTPGIPEDEAWYTQHYSPFYMHHFKSLRYIMRSRRVVQWDGTFNQPIFPYLKNNDRSGLVHNGCNEIVESGANGLW